MMYYDMVVYGKMRIEGKALFKGSKIDQEKFIDFFGQYVAINNLALNIYAGFQNPIYGNAMIRMEAMAKEYISNKDLFKAGLIYATELPKVLAQTGKHYQTSRMQGWFDKFDTLQEQKSNTMNLDTNRRTLFGKAFKMGSLFFINHAGEHYMQGRMSLALAQNTRVTSKGVMRLNKYLRQDKEYWDLRNQHREETAKVKSRYKAPGEGGLTAKVQFGVAKETARKMEARKKIVEEEFYKFSSFWDAFEMDRNKLVVKDEFKDQVTQDDVTRFTLLQNFMNKRLHGIYNEIDRAAIQRWAIGRLAVMFRKFMKPGWNRRFQQLTYNEEAQGFTEGIYTTSFNFMKQLVFDLNKGRYVAKAHWHQLEEFQKANFIRTLTEVSYVLAAQALAMVLSNLGEGDDDDWLLNMSAYQANRLITELKAFRSLREFMKIAKSPAAAVNQWQKVADFVNTASHLKNWKEEISRGKYKGMTRVHRQAMEVIPLAGTLSDYMHPADKMMYFLGSNY